MNEAARADRVVVIHDGKLILDGTPHEVFANYGLLRECRLDVPQSNALLHELKARGVEIDTDSITPNEVAEKILALYRKKHGGSLNG